MAKWYSKAVPGKAQPSTPPLPPFLSQYGLLVEPEGSTTATARDTLLAGHLLAKRCRLLHHGSRLSGNANGAFGLLKPVEAKWHS